MSLLISHDPLNPRAPRRPTTRCGVSCLAIACLLVACDDSGLTQPGPSDGGDLVTSPPSPRCNDVLFLPGDVLPRYVPDGFVPGIGGTILDGSYQETDFVSREPSDSPDSGALPGALTLRIAGSAWDWVESNTSRQTDRVTMTDENHTAAVNGDGTVTLTLTCLGGQLQNIQYPWAYYVPRSDAGAPSTELVLYDLASGMPPIRTLVFRKQ